ncbi:MAG: hypothetical protein CVT88_03150, partial [Candidatus Altiarchaeales archaeon HGW-Altiarchaeales-1]
MKKFLIYVDILGFKNLPEEIAKNTKFYEDTITENFFTKPFRKRIDEITKEENIKLTNGKSEIEGSKGSDNYVLFVNDIDRVFEILHKISTIKIPHEDYGYIQMEIAVGVKEIDESEDIEDWINRKKTKQFLHEDIINPYKKYKKEKDGKSTEETFIVITNDFYNELENFNKKKFCEEINYKEKHFYYVKKELIEREEKISDFLKEIRQSRSDFSGALIDRIFVKPDEYDEIKKSLKNNRIVFITGTAGYGKTYLAIKLLWEKYDDEGYIPRWISIGSGSEKEITEVAKELIDIEKHLKPKHIIYFEDPFGKTKTVYERRDVLRERIKAIINSVKNTKDCYVIITSRKDVFEKFKEESYSIEEIEKFEKELNIMAPSYSYDKRKEILEKWAEEKGCKWLKDEKLRNIVFDFIGDKGKLPVPHNIHDFVEATIEINDETELRKKIKVYSQEGEKAFADEITGLYKSDRKDRMLFLSFILVSENFEKEFIKQEYENLKEENFEDFEKILKEEYRVIPTIWGVGEKEILKFAHPSYSQAIPYVLEDVVCRKIFCNVLKELAEKD